MENHPSLLVGGPRGPGREQSQYQPSFCLLPSSQPERRLMTRGPPLAFWGIALRGWSPAPRTAGGPRRLAGSQKAFWSQQGCLPDPGRKQEHITHPSQMGSPRTRSGPQPPAATHPPTTPPGVTHALYRASALLHLRLFLRQGLTLYPSGPQTCSDPPASMLRSSPCPTQLHNLITVLFLYYGYAYLANMCVCAGCLEARRGPPEVADMGAG